MVARRLLIVMVIMLGVATLAAALVPERALREETTESTTTEATEPTTTEAALPRGEGKGYRFKLEKGAVKVVEARVGDQLSLTIDSYRSGLLEIPALGLVAAVAPGAPARFEVLAREPDSYGIRFIDANEIVARIEIGGR